MSVPRTLELTGKIEDFPALELLDEATVTGLSGTFRLTSEPHKIAVYLSDGQIVFAASNTREHRLAFKLRQSRAVPENDLKMLSNLPEADLAGKLLESGKISPDQLAITKAAQVTEILLTALAWTTGDWNFNSLVRVREDLRVAIDLPKIIVAAARQMPADFVQKRLDADSGTFQLSPNVAAPKFDLLPEEAYVLSRFDDSMNAARAAMICGLPLEKTCRILYSLWLGGLLERFDYQTAFDEATITQIRSAKIAVSPKVPSGVAAPPPIVTTEAVSKIIGPAAAAAPPQVTAEKLLEAALPPPKEPEISEQEQVASFLQRVETAKSYYQILGVMNTAAIPDIKQTYFKLAKKFHPDKFHSVGGVTHSRLQTAFTLLAQAYEKLKDAKSRELYDFKLSKQTALTGDKSDPSQFTPEEIYRSGVKELQSGNYNQAMAYLNRAVQLAPNVAEYQARLGQALAVNPKFRHQAEEKMQQAIKLDEKNADWRLLLAEYYITVGLTKRAESELNRLLLIYPSHPAAEQLLAQLR